MLEWSVREELFGASAYTNWTKVTSKAENQQGLLEDGYAALGPLVDSTILEMEKALDKDLPPAKLCYLHSQTHPGHSETYGLWFRQWPVWVGECSLSRGNHPEPFPRAFPPLPGNKK